MEDKGISVLAFNLYYPPDTAATGAYVAGIVTGLERRGHDVDVVVGEPSYRSIDEDASSVDEIGNVRVERVSLLGFRGTDNFPVRVATYLCYLWQVLWKGSRLVRDNSYNVILSFHNPPLLGAVAAYLSTKGSVPLVYAPQDIHPHAGLEKYSVPSIIEDMWMGLETWALEKADQVIVLTREMATMYTTKFGIRPEKMVVSSLWALKEEKRIKISDQKGEGEQAPVFLWSGNMGAVHKVSPFIEAFREAKGNQRLILVGDGPRAEKARNMVPEESRTISFLEYMPDDEYDRLLESADVGVVGLRGGAGIYCMPSRVLTFLAVGLPVLLYYSGDNDLSRLINECHCGWRVSSVPELLSLIDTLSRRPETLRRYAKNAKDVYRRRFSREVTVERYEEVLIQARR